MKPLFSIERRIRLSTLEQAGAILDEAEARIKQMAKVLSVAVAQAGESYGIRAILASDPVQPLPTEINGVPLWFDVVILTIIMDYEQTVSEMIATGGYNEVHEDINDQHFPPAKQETGKKDLRFILYQLDKGMESDLIVSRMRKDGKRPATVRELLAFAQANPNLQRQLSVAALGSAWRNQTIQNYRYVVVLDGHISTRNLTLRWYGHGWHHYNCFLAADE